MCNGPLNFSSGQRVFDNYRAKFPLLLGLFIRLISFWWCHHWKGWPTLSDGMFGTDSHTTMINGIIGVLELLVGLRLRLYVGEASYFPVPEVIGVRLLGKLPKIATATDLAKVTQILRQENVVDEICREFFGAGLSNLVWLTGLQW